MKFSTLSAACLAAASTVLSHPTRDVSPANDAIKARQNGQVVTAGAPGPVQTRLEIRQMYNKYPDQWSLFIQAMVQFKNTKQTSSTSFYAIAGIHGFPRQDYDGVSECRNCRGSNGYCTHSSVLFPAWHRAYVALWEQEFLAIVQQVAASYPTGTSKDAMQAAANAMRFPYWDWAATPANDGNVIPDLITNTTLVIDTASGAQTIANPLYSYDFPQINNLNNAPYTTWKSTLRYPTSNTASASSQPDQLIDAFQSKQSSLKRRVYGLMQTCDDYLHFSNDHAGSSSTRCSTSLESIHNTIHTLGGGPTTNGVHGGHMTYLPVAAFDPLFWLHHTNVDRLFALWQTLYPDSYGARQRASMSTWTIAKGSYQDADSPLKPFRSDTNGNFWTTNQVQDWRETFHYTYPEFADSTGDKKAISAYINNLYGPRGTATAGSSKRDNAASPYVDITGANYEYVANIHAPRFGLDGSYAIHFFLGQPQSEDPATWLHDPNSIDMVGVTSREGMQDNDLTVSDSIPLTASLTEVHSRDASVFKDLSAAEVVPYLRANFQWRIAGPNGKAVDPQSLSGFQVAVFSSTSQPLTNVEELPSWSEFVGLPEVTEGRAGGAGDGAKIFAPEA